jgi:hypothetical protein
MFMSYKNLKVPRATEEALQFWGKNHQVTMSFYKGKK